MEIAWRWSFGAAACFLLLRGWERLSQSVVITNADVVAWRMRDTMAVSAALVRIAGESGDKILSVAVLVVPAITLLWIVLASFGRRATLNRLARGRCEVGLGPMLGLHFLRALSMWVGCFVLIVTVGLEGQVATRGDKPDYVLYYLLLLPSLLIIAVLWTMINWYLSLAPVCAGIEKDMGAFRAIRQAVKVGRLRRAELGSASVLSMLLRLAGLMLVFVLCVMTSGWMGPHPRAYAAWVAAVSLAYFAFADFLFVARLASFVESVSRPEETAGPLANPGPPSSSVAARG